MTAGRVVETPFNRVASIDNRESDPSVCFVEESACDGFDTTPPVLP